MMKRSEMEALEARGVCVPTCGEAEAEMMEAYASYDWDAPSTSAQFDPWLNPSPVDMVPAPW